MHELKHFLRLQPVLQHYRPQVAVFVDVKIIFREPEADVVALQLR